MISSDVQLGVSIFLAVLFGLSYTADFGLGGSVTLPKLLIAMAALLFWSFSLTYQKEGKNEWFDVSTLLTALVSGAAFAYAFLYGTAVSHSTALVLGGALVLGIYVMMTWVETTYLDEKEPPVKFTIAQPAAQRCPEVSIDALVSDIDWATFVNGTKRQQRRLLDEKYVPRFHPINCGPCSRTCTETFHYATTYLK